ncbi:MAG: rod shape-determining protein MreC [Nitrospinae bacterium]|nr:rod shape-determining protein MreC [Nitrospinota bacterium]
MNDFMRRYQDMIVLVALLALSLFMLSSNLRRKKTLNFMEKAAMTVVAPFQEVTAFSVSSLSNIWNGYISLVGVQEENQRLKAALDKLAFDNLQLVERLKTYQRLDGLLTFPRLAEVPFEVAQVIGRDPADRAKMLVVNKGYAQGVAENMAVVTHRGVVGRVVSVARASSKVLLITDVRSAVDAIALESRDSLVAAGDNKSTLEAKYLPFNAGVKNGDLVISSGLGGVFPKGLVIGVVEEAKSVSGSLFMTARIRPTEDFTRLEEALILKAQWPGPEEEEFTEVK